MSRGIDFREAKERINNLIQAQYQIRESMKTNKKSEKDIKIKQAELLEELWNY